MIKLLGNHRVITAKNKTFVTLDFNPLLNSLANNAKFQAVKPEHFILAHWNKILALPAYYCPQSGEYIVAEETEINIQCSEHFWIGISRDEHNVLPTSVLLYPNAQMVKIDNQLVIDKA